ncbi:hypothetical protein JQ615_18240 [Bradyrhizobium jicamae]|uniref:Uncharacterized protein n=1 Tax=Bradyrhizobium jicamae TaxID=280332 RepID=A0ABS5FKL4_9BRAD|nr:hypothetical protein [Bradyrhizobium jicamae]MBR0797332.1 hypothetical protein [Bradyrhizobium jicamae]MBR0936191.1 hypothetical protein [Bradyrhizobium jicamae]
MHADARQWRSSGPWLVVALIVVLVAGGFLWMAYGTGMQWAGSQQKAQLSPPPADPAIEQIKQTLASLQQAVQGIQSDQQKLADQINGVQRNVSTQRGDQKLLSDQLGSLSARVDALASARAESPAPQPAPSPQERTKRGRR